MSIQTIRLVLKKMFYIFVGCILIVGVTAVFNLLIIPPKVAIDPAVLSVDTDGVFFLGRVYQVDLPDRTISISWTVGGCGNLRLQNASSFTNSQCGLPNAPLAVYIDNEPQFEYDPTIQPRTLTDDTLLVQDLNQFQHTHTIDINNAHFVNRIFEQEYFYPFESYGLTTTFIAFNTADTTSLPILSLALSDIVSNFHPYWNETETQSFANNTSMHSRTVRVRLERTPGAKVYVMLLFSMNWLLTVAVLYITAIALSGLKFDIGDSIALLPMTILLTLPLLRQFFTDVPAFGIFLDSLGLVPQLFLVSICAIILLCFTIKLKPSQEALNVKSREFDARTVVDTDPLLPCK